MRGPAAPREATRTLKVSGSKGYGRVEFDFHDKIREGWLRGYEGEARGAKVR